MIPSTAQPSKERTYQSVANDPGKVRIYTLDNGLTIYLAQNQDAPQIQTYIAVRAGSNYDPKDNTGLAHYLEHMLFKGSSKFGTSNWEKEAPLLEKIADLYEQHKAEKDLQKKKAIYAQIDAVSSQAGAYAIPNEYDQMIASLGGKATNAHTWFEETVYQNIIPNTSLEKWMKIESERFSKLVLRLFHTELETVYEEFNRGQDNDDSEQFDRLLRALFPHHPYGQQTTIGTSEHLKNPSMKSIEAYFKTYYVPNNMAIVLVGDLEFEPTIALVEKYFGGFKKQPIEKPVLPQETPLTAPVADTVSGPSPASVLLGFRTAGVGTKDELYAEVVQALLYNGTAGLMDIDLNQKQKVQNSYAVYVAQNDFGFHVFAGQPKQNQTLENVRDLLLHEIERIKKGAFEDWMLEAIINNLKLQEIKKYEDATALASELYNAYVHFQPWEQSVNFVENLSKVTKEEIVAFANKTYLDNYAIVYKKQGANNYAVKVEKPTITPIAMNKEAVSEFNKEVSRIPSKENAPLFIDYKKEITKVNAGKNFSISFVQNKNNDLYELGYVFDMGSRHMKELSVAEKYMDLLGTDKYSPEEIKKEFYKLATQFRFSVSDRRLTISISGLYGRSFPKAVQLLEHYIAHVKADKTIYEDMVETIAKEREDEKSDKGSILFGGLYNLCLYGEQSPLKKDRYTIAELKALNPEKIVSVIKMLPSYAHEVFYYGTQPNEVATVLKKEHPMPSKPLAYPPLEPLKMRTPDRTVYVTNFDMVQGEIMFLTKDGMLEPKNFGLIRTFNNYFGAGMSSVVFREIRESQALAYSASAKYKTPAQKDQENVLYGYVGTQVDKLPQAVNALQKLLTDMPLSEDFFKAAKQGALKEIESERITKTHIIRSYLALRDIGIYEDIRKQMYADIKNISLADIHKFFNTHIKNKTYNFILVGDTKKLDMNALEKLGKVKIIDVNYLFEK